MNAGAVILAAGNSSRLGTAKQLLGHPRGTLIGNAIFATHAAGCSPIIVVSGAVELSLPPSLAGDVQIVFNPDWSAGMGSSIRRGVAALIEAQPDVDRLLILVCDQPALSDRVIADLLNIWRASGKPIAACRYGDSSGPPCGFDRSCFDALLNLPPNSGAKHLLRDADRVATLPWPAGATDIDTPDDLRNYRATL